MAKYIEEGTNYSYIVKRMKDVNFRSLRNVSVDFTRRLPEDLSNELYKDIQHGVCQLQSEPELNMYIHALGMMHEFEHLAIDFFSHSSIDIIDYGCGQAIGTICYADFLREKGYSQKVRKVTLIEPSELALKRAALHVSCFFPNAEIVTILKGFDDLIDDDISVDGDVPTLHILSNVIDLADDCFNLEDFTTLIKDNIKGENHFVCIEPYFGYDEEDEKLERFTELLDIDFYYNKVFTKGTFVEGREWTCCVAIGRNGYDIVVDETDIDLLLEYASEAEDRKDYKMAFEYYKLVAEQGDAFAQFKLGVCYKNGQGVGKDECEAVKWYRKSAEQCHARAQCNLGFCYERGIGIDKDEEEAVKWYRKSAEQGNAIAQFNLGNCYKKGQGVEKDEEEAVKWYRKSAEQGHVSAQFNLGRCYENAYGVDEDEEEAVKWYRMSAEQGNRDAQFDLGWCYENAYGVDEDEEEAVKWYRMSAEQGNKDAQFNLGWCYENAYGVDEDIEEAIRWYCKSAEQDNEEAKNNLIRIIAAKYK